MQYLSQQQARFAPATFDQKPCVAELVAEAITRSVKE
jgi:hypothetical protein